MAIAGIGCEFQQVTVIAGAGGTHSWKNLAEIMNVDGPSPERDTYDTTTIDTPGNYRTFIPGLKDGGEVTLEMNFTRETYGSFKTEFDKENEEAITWYSIVFNDHATPANKSTLYFRAMVTTLGTAVPTDDKVSSNVTLKVDGEPFLANRSVRDNDTNNIIDGSGASARLSWRGFVQDLAYSAAFSVTFPEAMGGIAPVTYSLTDNNVAGLSFTAGTRVFAGTNAVVNGVYPLVYEAEDANGNEVRQAIILTIT